VPIMIREAVAAIDRSSLVNACLSGRILRRVYAIGNNGFEWIFIVASSWRPKGRLHTAHNRD
jgi:hypothetical protein